MENIDKLKKRIADFVSSQHFKDVDVNSSIETHSDIEFFESKKKELIKQNYSKHQAYKIALTEIIDNVFNEHLNMSDVRSSYDNDWNNAFNKVEEGLKNQPIHYKDSHNLRGEVCLKELYENYGIDFQDGLDQLVDLVAYLISEGGYKIIKK